MSDAWPLWLTATGLAISLVCVFVYVRYPSHLVSRFLDRVADRIYEGMDSYLKRRRDDLQT